MGTEVARGTREIVKAQIDPNQEGNAATESNFGKRCEGVSTTTTGIPDLRQAAGEVRKESSIQGGGTRK